MVILASAGVKSNIDPMKNAAEEVVVAPLASLNEAQCDSAWSSFLFTGESSSCKCLECALQLGRCSNAMSAGV